MAFYYTPIHAESDGKYRMGEGKKKRKKGGRDEGEKAGRTEFKRSF